MAIKTKNIDYPLGDQPFSGFIAFDNSLSGKQPIVLIAPTWRGCDELAKQQACEIAKLGYIGFAIDMYGNGNKGTTPDECEALMQPLINNRVLLKERINHALSTASKLENVDDEKMAAIGFCFGGLCVLDLARSSAQLNGVASIHGLLNKPSANQAIPIHAKVLVLHGSEDPLAPLEDVQSLIQELNTVKADWEISLYGKTAHAFTNPAAKFPEQGLQYNEYANQRAWKSLEHFLKSIFNT